MTDKTIFDVVDPYFLGRVRLLETETYFSLHVGRRDIQINKKTGELEGSGYYVADPLPSNMRPEQVSL